MKILIVNDFTEEIGGVEIYDHRLKELLINRGHNVELVGGASNTSSSKISIVKRFISSYFNIRYMTLIGKYIRKLKPDIIFAHSICENISPSFLLEAKKEKIPTILKIPNIYQYIHNLPYTKEILNHDKIKDILIQFKKTIHIFLVKKYVDLFIAPSNNTKRIFKEMFDIENLKVIPNPVFLKIRNTIYKKKYNKNNKIIFVGRIDKYKGLEYLIDAITIIKHELDNVVLDIIGTGNKEYIYNLKEQVRSKNLQDNVYFRGYIPHKKLAKIYSNADVCVLPSIVEENFPLVLLESMSQGTPVVTTKIGGQAELVREGYNGYLAIPKDSYDLAEKILKILEDNKLRMKLSRNSIEFAKMFTPEKHVTELEKLFCEMVNLR